MRKPIQLVLAASVAAGVAVPSLAAIYTSGNLVLTQVGTGGTIGNAAFGVTLREFGLGTPLTGTFVNNDLALPSSPLDSQRLTVSGSATSEGTITRSFDQRYLTLAGYNAPVAATGVGGGSIATSSNVSGGATPQYTRTVGRVAYDQGTVLNDVTSAYSNSNIRSAWTLDGTSYYIGGTSGTSVANANTGGVRLLTPPVTTPTAQSTNQNNVRVVNYNPRGEVVVSAQSTTVTSNGLFLLTGGGTASQLPGFAAASGTGNINAQDFWFADGNTVYIADEGSLTGTTGTAPNVKTNLGGLQKWIFDGVTWSLAARFTGAGAVDDTSTAATETALTAGLRGLTGVVNADGAVTLYATTADTLPKLVAFVDNGAATLSTPFYQLAVSATGTAFRGVEFTPIPAPGAAALAALAGLAAARRRR